MFVEAIEDSELIQIDYNAVQLLYSQALEFERFFRIITKRSYVFLQKRVIPNISMQQRQGAWILLAANRMGIKVERNPGDWRCTGRQRYNATMQY